MREVHLNPIDENKLEDKRNEICENCFIELDISLKGYKLCFGEDMVSDEIDLLHSTFAFLSSNHKNTHRLANIDIRKFEIQNSPFKTEDGEPTDKLYNLKELDKIHYLTNLIINSKSGFIELSKSGYFDVLKSEEYLMVDKKSLLFQIGFLFDRCILMLNNKYNKTNN